MLEFDAIVLLVLYCYVCWVILVVFIDCVILRACFLWDCCGLFAGVLFLRLDFLSLDYCMFVLHLVLVRVLCLLCFMLSEGG